MFLFRSKVLHGSVNNNECPVVLSKPSGGIVAEFDFDLSLEKGSFPPSFNSNDVFISYELKADVQFVEVKRHELLSVFLICFQC